MKWVFVFLLAANFVYLGWNMQHGNKKGLSPTSPESSLPPETGNLKLLSELNQLPPKRNNAEAGKPGQTQSPQAPSEDTISSTPVVPGSCFNIGPFDTKADAESFRSEQLADRVSKVDERPDNDLKKKLFWIYLTPESSEQKARQKLQDLKRKGVKDYMLIQRGGLKNAISLGVFSSQESVNKRLAELGEKGYQPVVVPRYEAEKSYWVGLKLGMGDPLPPSISAALPSGVQAEPIACRKIALATPRP